MFDIWYYRRLNRRKRSHSDFFRLQIFVFLQIHTSDFFIQRMLKIDVKNTNI